MIGFKTLLIKEILRFWKGRESYRAGAPGGSGERAKRLQPTFQNGAAEVVR
jgi:hypothetical protein